MKGPSRVNSTEKRHEGRQDAKLAQAKLAKSETRSNSVCEGRVRAQMRGSHLHGQTRGSRCARRREGRVACSHARVALRAHTRGLRCERRHEGLIACSNMRVALQTRRSRRVHKCQGRATCADARVASRVQTQWSRCMPRREVHVTCSDVKVVPTRSSHPCKAHVGILGIGCSWHQKKWKKIEKKIHKIQNYISEWVRQLYEQEYHG